MLEGIYPAECLRWDHRPDPRWGEKEVFEYRIFRSSALASGDSTILYRYYNIKRNENGRLVFGHRHEYRKDWIAANSGRHPNDWNSLPPSIFKRGLLLVSVVTVRKDSKGPLLKTLYYSRVDRVIGPVDAEEQFNSLPLQPCEEAG
jgi:hypothetical protein